jgi:Flp pilus assembly protein TadG
MAATEMAIVAPFLVIILLLVVFVGRVSEADANVRRAASEAARAASRRQDSGSAVAAAESTVEANLVASGLSCAVLDVDVNTAAFQPGGWVGVTVTCQASRSDLALLGVPGTRTFSAHTVEVIDRYVGVPGASRPGGS